MDFSNLLINWYLLNKRDLPWRNTTNPYLIFLSEIILQQTRVSQGLPYYNAFVSKYPTVFDLANATEQDVLKTWQGLGYYSRARNMHATATLISTELNGQFPDNYTDLLKLKGVGTYTAAAIASFAYNEHVAVVDGNVLRVLSRVFGVDADISANSSKKIFQELADKLLFKDNPSVFNQAIMEFGALQCVPKNPNCDICVFNAFCVAKQLDKVGELPVKTKKTKVTKRYLHYIVLQDSENKTRIQKRQGKGIWENLYEFPLIELSNEQIPSDFSTQIIDLLPNEKVVEVTQLSDFVIHKLSHQELHIHFWKATLNTILFDGCSITKLSEFPFPVVLANFIENNWPTVSLISKNSTFD